MGRADLEAEEAESLFLPLLFPRVIGALIKLRQGPLLQRIGFCGAKPPGVTLSDDIWVSVLSLNPQVFPKSPAWGFWVARSKQRERFIGSHPQLLRKSGLDTARWDCCLGSGTGTSRTLYPLLPFCLDAFKVLPQDFL